MVVNRAVLLYNKLFVLKIESGFNNEDIEGDIRRDIDPFGGGDAVTSGRIFDGITAEAGPTFA